MIVAMVQAVLALLGLSFAFWNLSSLERREELRTLALVRWQLLRSALVAALSLVLLVPLLSGVIVAVCSGFERYTRLVDALSILALAGLSVGAVSLLRPAPWNADRVALLNARVDDLMRTGRASLVAALVAKVLRQVRSPDQFIDLRAGRLIERCFLFPVFSSVLVNEQTACAGQLLTLQHEAVLRHSDRLIEAAFVVPDGVLPLELSRCQNFAGTGVGYHIPETCPLLLGLFEDATVAERLHAWAPVGAVVRRTLAARRLVTSPDPGNEPIDGRYDDRDRWRSPEGAGLWYFRLMLTSAMQQGIQWHMWLYYLPHFVTDIVANIRVAPEREHEEFPNRYAYVLYDCFALLQELAAGVDRLPEGNPHRNPVSPNTANENASIPKSSVIALARCLRTVLASEHVPKRFKTERIQGVADLYETLQRRAVPAGLSDVLVMALQSECTGGCRLELLGALRHLQSTEGHRPQYNDLLRRVGE